MINVVIPMAGAGSRFLAAGYKKPKPFIDVFGKPMIAHVMENLAYENVNYILIARKEHILGEPALVRGIISKYNATIITIDKLTEGTAITVLHARKLINNALPLLIANSDQLVDINVSDFIDDCFQKKLNGSILTFTEMTLNPKWSFAKVNEHGLVTEVKEKHAISQYATVGLYLYSSGTIFVNAAIDMIAQNERVNGEFYTCPTYNYAIREGFRIGNYNISPDQMHGLGTPEDLEKFLANFQK